MIGELGEVFEWLRAGFAGWRFLFSPKYREMVFLRWKGESRWSVLWDVVGGCAGVLFSVGMIYVIGFVVFSPAS
jgi:hypothetical protein